MKDAFRHLLRKPVGDEDERLTQARDPAYWRALDATLHVEGPAPAATAPLAAVDEDSLKRRILEDGYLRTEPLIPEAALARVLGAAKTVERAGWPFVFAWLYDEVWDAIRAPGVVDALSALLGEGHRQLPGVWLHFVPALEGARGWGPHVDVARRPRFLPDGRADRLTVWIPLTDAGVDNACLYVVPPRHAPPGLAERFDHLETIDMTTALRLLHAARPLPAAPGSLLAWRLDVVHWGGFHTGESDAPRWALSLEYLHEREEPSLAEGFALDARSRPSFEARLQLVGRGLLAYGKAEDREPFAHRFLSLGERLWRG